MAGTWVQSIFDVLARALRSSNTERVPVLPLSSNDGALLGRCRLLHGTMIVRLGCAALAYRGGVAESAALRLGLIHDRSSVTTPLES